MTTENYRKSHVFDPISNDTEECECGLVKDAEVHETDEQYERRMRPRIINAPERIWLQTGCDDEVGAIDWNELAHEEVSWCAERIDRTDIEYVCADLVSSASAPPEWLAEIEKTCNAALLDIYDLSIANAPLSAGDCREIADCIGHRVGQIREALAAIRTTPPVTEAAAVVAARDEILRLIHHRYVLTFRTEEVKGYCPICEPWGHLTKEPPTLRGDIAAIISKHCGAPSPNWPDVPPEDDVPVLLAGQGYATPEKGFTGWADALHELKRCIRERCATPGDSKTRLIDAVMYALKEGCFFPVPEPKPGASVRELIQWGAMRHLHDAIANYRKEAAGSVPAEAQPTDATEWESVAQATAEIDRLTQWQDLCFELISEIQQWVAPGSIRDTDAPRVLRALLNERTQLKQQATQPDDPEKLARESYTALLQQVVKCGLLYDRAHILFPPALRRISNALGDDGLATPPEK